MDDYKVKQIGDFPSATDITDDDVLLAEQAGKTRKLSGKVLKDFCRAAISVFTTRAETAATAAEAAKNAAAEIEQLIGEKAGVASFNGRAGIVVPQNGDYTAAMVGAAPAGYGLGGLSKLLTSAQSDDLNRVWENGSYYWSGGYPDVDTPANAPLFPNESANRYVFCSMQVRNTKIGNTVRVRQKVRYFDQSNYDMHSDVERTIVTSLNGNPSYQHPWEYVNPPMELGVEYRTTERYNGKPVYVKLLEVNPLPNNTGKYVNICPIAEFDSAVEVRGFIPDNLGHYKPYSSPSPAFVGSKQLSFEYSSGLEYATVGVSTNYDGTGTIGRVLVKYTKTTN